MFRDHFEICRLALSGRWDRLVDRKASIDLKKIRRRARNPRNLGRVVGNVLLAEGVRAGLTAWTITPAGAGAVTEFMRREGGDGPAYEAARGDLRAVWPCLSACYWLMTHPGRWGCLRLSVPTDGRRRKAWVVLNGRDYDVTFTFGEERIDITMEPRAPHIDRG